MAKLTGTTVPTKETKGALGDIYTDLRTGIQYKCTFAYCSADNEYYEWKNIGKEEKSSAEAKVVKEKKVEVEPAVANDKNETVTSQDDEEVEVEVEVESETKAESPQRKTNYTQYSSASSKKNK